MNRLDPDSLLQNFIQRQQTGLMQAKGRVYEQTNWVESDRVTILTLDSDLLFKFLTWYLRFLKLVFVKKVLFFFEMKAAYGGETPHSEAWVAPLINLYISAFRQIVGASIYKTH